MREFADAANRWGVGICYYLNVAADGYEKLVANYTADAFLASQLGMVREVLRAYGPVNRFWFDGTKSTPCAGAGKAALWDEIYHTIRSVSPATMISAYRGDVCAAQHGATLYTNDGPPPNSSDTSGCQPPRPDGRGKYFHPTEVHGITIQVRGDQIRSDQIKITARLPPFRRVPMAEPPTQPPLADALVAPTPLW